MQGGRSQLIHVLWIDYHFIMIRTSVLLLPALLISAADGITPEQAERLARQIRPQPSESSWAQIHWQTNLKAARIKSACEDKPLLLWRSGGGDVLGRT